MSKILVIGAGFTGATIARQLAEAGHEIDVYDSRSHVGGNAHDQIHEKTGIRYHTYGPHIFHTNNKKVVDWIKRFGTWDKYYHQVQAIDRDRKYVPFPPNRKTCVKHHFNKKKLIDIFFRPYTRKMWNMELEEIHPDVINRVPIDHDLFSNDYFKDKYQLLPRDGYTNFFKQLLNHENIIVWLGKKIRSDSIILDDYDMIFNSSPIDSWYGFKFGKLPYRSIKFHHQVVPSPVVFPKPTVNFTNNGQYTRATEWQNFPNHGHNDLETLLTFEEPCDYEDNKMERYYPVKDEAGDNRVIYRAYANLDHGNMKFVGRCGQYVYIDMHQAINSGLQIAENYLK